MRQEEKEANNRCFIKPVTLEATGVQDSPGSSGDDGEASPLPEEEKLGCFSTILEVLPGNNSQNFQFTWNAGEICSHSLGKEHSGKESQANTISGLR